MQVFYRGEQSTLVEKNQKQHVTFRLDQLVLAKLVEEANQKKSSLNALVNEVLKRHSYWGAHVIKTKNISMWKSFPAKLMERYSDDEIISITEEIARESYKDTVLVLSNEFTPITLLEVFEQWIATNFPYTHNASDKKHTFVIQHDMTRKWSWYIVTCAKTMFEEYSLKNFQHKSTDNIVMIEFELP